VQGAVLRFAEPIELGPGVQVTVCIRPEDVRVRKVVDGEPNRLTAQVGVMEFIGGYCSATLHAVGTDLHLSADLPMNDVRDLGIAPGQTVPTALPANRLRVFAEPHAGA
jgi:iron(III) transport system ATP-binding protein